MGPHALNAFIGLCDELRCACDTFLFYVSSKAHLSAKPNGQRQSIVKDFFSPKKLGSEEQRVVGKA